MPNDWPTVFRPEYQARALNRGVDLEKSYRKWMTRMVGEARAYELAVIAHKRMERDRRRRGR